MKKLLTTLALLLCLVIPAAMAEGTITVSGSGTVTTTADTAVVQLGISVTMKEVGQAQATVNNGIAAIRTALVEAGIADSDITTSTLNIYSDYSYEDDSVHYYASDILSIEVKDISTVGNIIDIAFSCGANTLYGVQFMTEDTSTAQDTAYALAVEDAMHKAQIMADASGSKLGKIVSITESGSYAVENGRTMTIEAAADKAAGTDVQASGVSVSESVTMVFELED